MGRLLPGGEQALNYSGSSSLPPPKLNASPMNKVVEGGRKRERTREKEREREGGVEGVIEGEGGKVWFEEPVVGFLSAKDNANFNIPFVTSLQSKPAPIASDSISTSDMLSSGQSESSSSGNGSEEQPPVQLRYMTPSLLPPASLPWLGEQWKVVCLSVQVGRVVVYCGDEERRGVGRGGGGGGGGGG